MAEQRYLERFDAAHARGQQMGRQTRKELLLWGATMLLIVPVILIVEVREAPILLLVMVVVTLGSSAVVLTRWHRRQWGAHTRPVVRDTLSRLGHGELQREWLAARKRRRRLQALHWLALLLAAAATFLLVKTVWPGSSPEAATLIALAALVLIHPFGEHLLARLQPAPLNAEDRLGWRILRSLLLLAILLLLGGLEQWLQGGSKNPRERGDGAAFLFALATALPFVFHMLVQSLLPSSWVQAALHRGDYERALRRVRLVRRLMPHDTAHVVLESSILLVAGRPAEAEALLIGRLAEQKGGLHMEVAQLLENLGLALLAQGRYDQARVALEATLDVAPNRPGPYGGLAELDLRQGQQERRALALAERGLELASGSLAGKIVQKESFAELAELKAWALAALGRHLDTEELLQQASKSAGRVPHQLARHHYRWGQVRQLAGHRSGAHEHFSQARAADPAGAYGALAAAALAQQQF